MAVKQHGGMPYVHTCSEPRLYCDYFKLTTEYSYILILLIHWDRVTHICVSNLTIIGSDNGLSPGRRQAIIWTNAGILLVGPLWTNINEILIEIHSLSFKKMHLKMSSGKWRSFCLGLNVLTSNIQAWGVCYVHSFYRILIKMLFITQFLTHGITLINIEQRASSIFRFRMSGDGYWQIDDCAIWQWSTLEEYGYTWWLIQIGNFLRVTGPLWREPTVTGGFPSQRPVTRNFCVFFGLRLTKRLSRQSRRRWLEASSRSLWRHWIH